MIGKNRTDGFRYYSTYFDIDKFLLFTFDKIFKLFMMFFVDYFSKALDLLKIKCYSISTVKILHSQKEN